MQNNKSNIAECLYSLTLRESLGPHKQGEIILDTDISVLNTEMLSLEDILDIFNIGTAGMIAYGDKLSNQETFSRYFDEGARKAKAFKKSNPSIELVIEDMANLKRLFEALEEKFIINFKGTRGAEIYTYTSPEKQTEIQEEKKD